MRNRENFMPVIDERIEAAIAKAGVTPEWCEWYGDPKKRVTFRVEAWMGRYAEYVFTPYMNDEDLLYCVRRTAERLEAS